MISVINSVVLFDYFGIHVEENTNCDFADHVLFGATDITLFNISMYISFSLYTVTNSVYKFAVYGRLPSIEKKKRNKRIIHLIWAILWIEVLVYIWFNIYWTFIKRDIHTLYIFIFCNNVVQTCMTAMNSILWFVSFRLLRKTLS